jgi:hypothetical protein
LRSHSIKPPLVLKNYNCKFLHFRLPWKGIE